MMEVNGVRITTNSPRRQQAYEYIVNRNANSPLRTTASLKRSKQHTIKTVSGSESLSRRSNPSTGQAKVGHRGPHDAAQGQADHHQGTNQSKLPHQTHVRSANLINYYDHDKYLKDIKYATLGKNEASENGTISSSLASDKLSLDTSPTNSTMTSIDSSGQSLSHHSGKALKSPVAKGKGKSPKEHRDPALRRFEFIQNTLLTANIVILILGFTGLIVAGFVDPRPVYKLNTFGAQMTLASVYMIITSLTGLYGARRESCSLLVFYAILIIGSLFCRSVFYFVATFISSGSTIALSMCAAFLEVILILFAFALALEVRAKKLIKKKQQQVTGDQVDLVNKQSIAV
ncbi:hypothetical protein HDE_02719 [Halotydeus destructor]|nr:hypothetical protein HDE_02719 [Halotydeus destructor]